MFPNILDNATVYFYTQKWDYGSVSYDNKEYYLFHCNDKFEVIADYLFDSIEECKEIASKCKKDIVWIKNQ